MKKILLSLLLVAIFILPASAKMNFDFIAKCGILASPYLNLDKQLDSIPLQKDFNNNILDVDLGYILGGEVFMYPWKRIGLGLGIEHLFKTDIENTAQKLQSTNFYVAAKPKIIVNKQKEIDSLYLIAQLGVSQAEIKLIDANTTGLFLAGGVGIEAKWLILEVLYSYYNWTLKDNEYASHASMYSLQLNLGFKYSI